MRIGVYGLGYVGLTGAICLASEGHDLVGVDVSDDKVRKIASGASPIREPGLDAMLADALAAGRLRCTTDPFEPTRTCDLAIVCVGTPSAPDGSHNMRDIAEVTRQIASGLREAGRKERFTVVYRSTIRPGSIDGLILPIFESALGGALDVVEVVYNPEFLREATAVKDFFHPPKVVVGTADGKPSERVEEMNRNLDAPAFTVGYREAEFTKFVDNSFHALKVAYANEIGRVCVNLGIDAKVVHQIFVSDTKLNISPYYLRPGGPFGGSCLPKDIRSFLAIAGHAGVPVPFLSQVLPSNATVVERTYAAIARHGRQRVSLFGLSFKPGTDDLRESPFVVLAERLIGRGYDVRIFDRSVRVASLLGANRSYIEREIPHLDRLMTASPAEALEGSRLVVFGHIAAEDRSALLAGLTDQTVLDLAGSAALQAHPGIAYQGLCW